MLYNRDSLLEEAGNKLVGQYWRREDFAYPGNMAFKSSSTLILNSVFFFPHSVCVCVCAFFFFFKEFKVVVSFGFVFTVLRILFDSCVKS